MEFPSLNNKLYTPPQVPSKLRDYAQQVPSMQNLMTQYRAYKQRNRKPTPESMRNVTEASKEAMQHIRSVAGYSNRNTKPPMVKQYEKMTMADFEQMRQEHGFDAVSEFIRNAEYQRLGGSNASR